MENGAVNERDRKGIMVKRHRESTKLYHQLQVQALYYGLNIRALLLYYCINNDGIIDHGRDFSK
jgi:hypothetical protein